MLFSASMISQSVISLSLLSLLWLFAGCSDKVAGGTTGVENPGIELALADSTGKKSSSGDISLWEKDQNPIQQPQALFKKTFKEMDKIHIKGTELQSAWEEFNLRLPGSKPDSLFRFNLVILSDQGSSIESGYELLRDSNGVFSLKRSTLNDTLRAVKGGQVASSVQLAPLINNSGGNIGIEGTAANLSHVYIPGSPFFAVVQSNGQFNFSQLPSGIHPLMSYDQAEQSYKAGEDFDPTKSYKAKSWKRSDRVWINYP